IVSSPWPNALRASAETRNNPLKFEPVMLYRRFAALADQTGTAQHSSPMPSPDLRESGGHNSETIGIFVHGWSVPSTVFEVVAPSALECTPCPSAPRPHLPHPIRLPQSRPRRA